MATIKRVPVDLFRADGGERMTEAQRKRAALDAQLRRAVKRLDDKNALVVSPSAGEKTSTLKNRLVKVSQEVGVRLAIRKHGQGWLVGIYSELTKPTRGRKPRAG
jgi:hypothetical protein